MRIDSARRCLRVLRLSILRMTTASLETCANEALNTVSLLSLTTTWSETG